jgi:hypothetical protein
MFGVSQEATLWIVLIALAVAAALVVRRVYYSRPHEFPSYHGEVHTWHPGDTFTDGDGRAVTDPTTIANLMRAWRGHNSGRG